ncbi:MAG: glutamate-5-semialdehyde dehydrogenase [Geminicoccaceae bacterium]|nr:MAG: glutamate-5-semialdehyde dehydrogenase [Geminicoccaceae bacterium]
MAVALEATDDQEARMRELGRAAKAAAGALARATTDAKNDALRAAARALRARETGILQANAQDLEAGAAAGLGAAVLDRLRLDPKRLAAMAEGIEAVAALPDPVGRVLAGWTRPNGLRIERVATPLGVVGVIYESRPNVTADAAALCLKSGNAVILRGGSESFHSSRAIALAMIAGVGAAGLPAHAIQLVPTTDRTAVGHMLAMDRYIDVLVPRGGRSLVERVRAEARMPVFAHLDGNCHVYLHHAADLKMAMTVTLNAKMRRTGICGAAETLLVDEAAAERLLLPVLDALRAAGCALRGCARTQALDPAVTPATAADWSTEYLDAILAVKVVDGLDDAIAHVNRYGSHHTDAIVTADQAAAERFLAQVDSAIVLHNASTQFADGGEFGMGAEIGIATGRLHARGPVGVEQLTTFNYRVRGTGQVRPS